MKTYNEVRMLTDRAVKVETFINNLRNYGYGNIIKDDKWNVLIAKASQLNRVYDEGESIHYFCLALADVLEEVLEGGEIG